MQKKTKLILGIAGGLIVIGSVAGFTTISSKSPGPKTATITATTAPAEPVASGPTVASGCAYIDTWFGSNAAPWHDIANDLGQISSDASDMDLYSVEADGEQLTDDVSDMSDLDNSQIPSGRNPASITAVDFAKIKLTLAVGGNAASSGNLSQAATDVDMASTTMAQTQTDLQNCGSQ